MTALEDDNPYRPPVEGEARTPNDATVDAAPAAPGSLPTLRPGGNKVLAFLLSLWQPGLGELYAGRLRMGLAWLAAYLVVAPILVWAWVARDENLVVGAFAAFLGNVGSRLLSAVMAARAAGREPRRWLGWGPVVGAGVGVYLVGSVIGATQRELVIESFKVPSGTMLPTVLEGDRILVTHWHDRDHDPTYGDIAVYELPDSPETLFYKRVVGRPGDFLEITAGRVFVNGYEFTVRDCPHMPVPLSGSKLRCAQETTPHGHVYMVAHGDDVKQETLTINLGPEEFFVLGDNRANSHDSRDHGPVRRSAIVGRVRAVWAGPGGAREIE